MPAGMTTPLRKSTFKKLLLDAGAFVYGVDFSAAKTVAALKTALAAALADNSKTLGATRGGGSFTVTREMRQVEVDGLRYRFVGDTRVDSADAYMSTTLLEIGNKNMMGAAMGTAETTTDGDLTIMKMKTRIEEEDYIQDLWWVGDQSDGGMIAIHFAYAFNTADLAVTWTDKGEATLPVEFHAYQGDVEDYDYAPYEVYFFAAPVVQNMTITSEAGTASGDTKLTVTGYTPATGESYLYKAASGTAPNIKKGDTPDYTWAAWDGESELTITNGYKVTVACINANGKVVTTGSATVVS